MADFSLVQKLADMRGQMAGAPTSLDSYAPPQLDLPTAAPAAAPAVGGTHTPGDGHNHSVDSSGKLVPIGNYKVDASVAPKFQALAAQFPKMRVTSGYRDPAHNAKVGGVKNSYHTKGRAMDLVGSAGEMARAKAWAEQNGATEALIHNVGSGQHLHVAW